MWCQGSCSDVAFFLGRNILTKQFQIVFLKGFEHCVVEVIPLCLAYSLVCEFLMFIFSPGVAPEEAVSSECSSPWLASWSHHAATLSVILGRTLQRTLHSGIWIDLENWEYPSRMHQRILSLIRAKNEKWMSETPSVFRLFVRKSRFHLELSE